MTRWYYAMECPYGATTASGGDRLVRFASRGTRDAWVREALESVDYADQCRRDEVSRVEARRWFPEAFKEEAQVWPPKWSGDYWDEQDGTEFGASFWIGAPTGGIYKDL